MNSIGFPAPSASNPVFTANPVSQQAIGEENTDTKKDIFKAVEETSETSASKASADSKSPVNNDKHQTDQQQQELAVIQDLAARDREVRAHEQAHVSVGGQYAGAASFTYQRGPNGVNYAVGGEVPISAPTGGDPEARLQAAEQIKRAALAPADPSAQDRQVAAQASQSATQARAEIATQASQQRADATSEETSKSNESQTSENQSDSANDLPASKPAAIDQAYPANAGNNEPGALLNQLV